MYDFLEKRWGLKSDQTENYMIERMWEAVSYALESLDEPLILRSGVDHFAVGDV